MNLLQIIDKEQRDALIQECPLVDFKPGDTIRVTTMRVKKSTSDKKGKPTAPVTYTEKFEGICITKTNKGMGSTFRVRNITNGMSVVVMFPLFGTKVDLLDKGVVRRAKPYYLLKLKGRKAKVESLRDYMSRKRAHPHKNKA